MNSLGGHFLFLVLQDINWKQCQLCFCCEKDLRKRWQLKINDNWFLYEFRLERVSNEIQWQLDFCCRAMITDFDLWKRMTIGNLRQLIFVWFWLLKRCLKESNDNSILCETITISNERTSPLSGRKIELLMIVTTVRCCRRSSRQRRWRVGGSDGWIWVLWVVVECNRQTNTTTYTTTEHWRQWRRRMGLYLFNYNVNFMHDSSRHQQFKLPSPAGAEQALGGASDD